MKIEMKAALETLMEKIKANYVAYHTRHGTRELNEFQTNMIAQYNESMEYTVGKKYIRVFKDGSVWGFIVVGNDPKFTEGTILKAAGWKTPARNFARGNIFDLDSFEASWVSSCAKSR